MGASSAPSSRQIAHSRRAVLLASATAALFLPRRATSPCSHTLNGSLRPPMPLTTARAPWISWLRRYVSPRLLMPRSCGSSLHSMAKLDELPPPVVRARARLHRDQARRQLRHNAQLLSAPHSTPLLTHSTGVHLVQLKHVLCEIDPHRRNLIHGPILLVSLRRLHALNLGPLLCKAVRGGWVHTNRDGLPTCRGSGPRRAGLAPRAERQPGISGSASCASSVSDSCQPR